MSLPALAACAGPFALCVSGPVYAEYEEVLQRPQFRRIEEAIRPTLEFVRKHGLWVRPEEPVRECRDPDDNIFLECAQAAEASWLVTGNVQDFPAVWQGIAIATPRRFLDNLATGEVRIVCRP